MKNPYKNFDDYIKPKTRIAILTLQIINLLIATLYALAMLLALLIGRIHEENQQIQVKLAKHDKPNNE